MNVRRYPYFYPYSGIKAEAGEALVRKGGSPFSLALTKALDVYLDLDLIHLYTGNRLEGIGRHMARKRHLPYIISLHGGAFDVPSEVI
ncbi:hypothetical protein ACFL1X_04110 [Candidatus Hydrogenedentota bacterium]